jgi:hypothetical protein
VGFDGLACKYDQVAVEFRFAEEGCEFLFQMWRSSGGELRSILLP